MHGRTRMNATRLHRNIGVHPRSSVVKLTGDMPDDARVRVMTEADLPAAIALKAAANWNQTEQDWRTLLTLEPGGCFVLEHEGRVVASATAYCYGADLAWIGMVLTAPECRGRGFGTRVFDAAVDYCRRRAVRCVKLDATDMGRPLYERAGFMAEYDVERWGLAPSPPAVAASPGEAVDLTDDSFRAQLPADRTAFGADRATLLAALRRNSSWCGCWFRAGAPAGYALARAGAKANYFGPCMAAAVEGARALLDAFLARHPGEPVYVDVPAGNLAARQLLERYGLTVQRRLVRMYLGANDRPGDPSRIYGLAGFEYG